VKFLRSCRKAGIERVGFTGGEPFLDTKFLFTVTERAETLGFLFGLITTNARWFKTASQLRRTLEDLRESGYDGSFGVSVDAFHGRSPAKPALFIEAALALWNRPDVARVISVRGAWDEETEAILGGLAGALKAKLVRVGGHRAIKNDSLFVPITTIDLSPVGKAEPLLDPWGKRWFHEDFCQGPGHVLYVLPNGDVKPCCGYATDSDRLTIGNIRRNSAATLIKNAAGNPFVSAVYREGLTGIRKRLVKRSETFPGAASDQCYFCHYVLNAVPRKILDSCLP
jgi:MoaA/NifB/PqqE/SkfB family radical SAM enzyme